MSSRDECETATQIEAIICPKCGEDGVHLLQGIDTFAVVDSFSREFELGYVYCESCDECWLYRQKKDEDC